MLKLIYMIICSILGAITGAILLGEFTSLWWSLAGAGIGGVAGWFFGKYVPFYELFS